MLTALQAGELWRVQDQLVSDVRLLVTGSREWADRDLLERTLREWAGEHRRVTVVHGAAWGADELADWVAREHGWTVEAYPADDFHHPTLRNAHMVSLGADRCLAFPTASSSGTWDCTRRAKAAGIVVTVTREPSAARPPVAPQDPVALATLSLPLPPAQCACAHEATLLCDAPVGEGTCSRPMCVACVGSRASGFACSRGRGKGRGCTPISFDLCSEHASQFGVAR